MPRRALLASLCAALHSVVLLCAGPLVGGCKGGGGEPPPEEPVDLSTPVRGDTLVVAYAGDIEGFNPVTGRVGATMHVLFNVFPQLVRGSFDCKLTFEPYLAESWTWS